MLQIALAVMVFLFGSMFVFVFRQLAAVTESTRQTNALINELGLEKLRRFRSEVDGLREQLDGVKGPLEDTTTKVVQLSTRVEELVRQVKPGTLSDTLAGLDKLTAQLDEKRSGSARSRLDAYTKKITEQGPRVFEKLEKFSDELDSGGNDTVAKRLENLRAQLDSGGNDTVAKRLENLKAQLDSAGKDTVAKRLETFGAQLDSAGKDTVAKRLNGLMEQLGDGADDKIIARVNSLAKLVGTPLVTPGSTNPQPTPSLGEQIASTEAALARLGSMLDQDHDEAVAKQIKDFQTLLASIKGDDPAQRLQNLCIHLGEPRK